GKILSNFLLLRYLKKIFYNSVAELRFIRLCYLLPRKLKAGSCEILFKPDGTEWTSAVYEVRLLK
ncbi:hypothetical protein GAC87_15505, partial [Bacteroides thetaiotaomicron]